MNASMWKTCIPCIKYSEHALKCSCEKDLVAVYKYICTWLDLQNSGHLVGQKTAILKCSKGFISWTLRSIFMKIFAKLNALLVFFFFPTWDIFCVHFPLTLQHLKKNWSRRLFKHINKNLKLLKTLRYICYIILKTLLRKEILLSLSNISFGHNVFISRLLQWRLYASPGDEELRPLYLQLRHTHKMQMVPVKADSLVSPLVWLQERSLEINYVYCKLALIIFPLIPMVYSLYHKRSRLTTSNAFFVSKKQTETTGS